MQILGEGNFAVVHLAKCYNICGHMGESKVAVKVLKGISWFFCVCVICHLFKMSFLYEFDFLYYSSTLPELFCKINALKNFSKSTGKHLRLSLLLIKLQTLLQFYLKETLAQAFSSEFWDIFKITCFVQHLRVATFVATAILYNIIVLIFAHFLSFQRRSL